MGLKQSIVIKNQFSVPDGAGGGSRGGTPGSYVGRYMAREGAVETLAPIQRLNTDQFITRYMAREGAVEAAEPLQATKERMKAAQGSGGVAFGYGSVSLSDEQLRKASADIQAKFDDGHTVLKTVLSFDEEFLREHKLLDEDFTFAGAGSYRGHLDQMKLRMAIMHGLDRMASGRFDDLRYVGVIQYDTEHIHCHLAMVDAGIGRKAKDGGQRGKLTDRDKSRLRRGIDNWLDEHQKVARLSSAVGYERRNVVSYIKRWAHQKAGGQALPQLLLAALPQDRRLWRAGTNDRRMRRANEVAVELVEQQLAAPDSPLPEAMESVVSYADRRREREKLSPTQWRQLVDNGRKKIVDRAVNGVYGMLKALPKRSLTVRTPMLEVMGMDVEQLAQKAAQADKDEAEDIVGFGYRLRSYSSRATHHRRQRQRNRDMVKAWDTADAAGATTEDSRPLRDFYAHEVQYHRQVLEKYQFFLPFEADQNPWWEKVEHWEDYARKLESLQALRADASLAKMQDAEQAERMGREIYDQPGGRLMTEGAIGRKVLDGRIAAMQERYEQGVAELREEMADSGLVLREQQAQPDGTGRLHISPGIQDRFDEIKALDLHQLGMDFGDDVEVDKEAARAFVGAAQRRQRLLAGAVQYLEQTDQAEQVQHLPLAEITAMGATAVKVKRQLDAGEPVIMSSELKRLRQQQYERSATVSLDDDLAAMLRKRVYEQIGTTPIVVDESGQVLVGDVARQARDEEREQSHSR